MKKRWAGVPVVPVILVLLAGVAVAGWLIVISATGTVSTSGIAVELLDPMWISAGDCTIVSQDADGFELAWAPSLDDQCVLNGEVELVAGSDPAQITGFQYDGAAGAISVTLDQNGKGIETCGLVVPATADPVTGNGWFKVTLTADGVAMNSSYDFVAGDGLLISEVGDPLLCP